MSKYKNNISQRDVQTEITNRIIKAIESGQVNGSWKMPWHITAANGWPVNAVTSQSYHGVNVLILSLTAEENTWPNSWATFKQWKERGASVRRGEHGTQVVFYTTLEIPETAEDAETEIRKIPLLATQQFSTSHRLTMLRS